MKRYLAGLATLLTIGLTITNANAFDRFKKGDYDVAGYEPQASPTWSPSWSPTWTPSPKVPDPAPTDPPQPVTYAPSSGALTATEVAGYLRAAGFPEYVIPTMVQIAYRESHFQPAVLNPISSACGLLQIWPFREGCTDPARNAAMGYAKFRAAQAAGGTGLEPWSWSA